MDSFFRNFHFTITNRIGDILRLREAYGALSHYVYHYQEKQGNKGVSPLPPEVIYENSLVALYVQGRDALVTLFKVAKRFGQVA